MKKCIVALLILLLILAAGIYNTYYIDKLTSSVLALANEAEASTVTGDFAAAVSTMERAAKRWEEAENYTYVFIRHSSVDTAADVFNDVLAELYDENAAAAQGIFRKLRMHLTTIADMERIRFGTIF